MAGSAVLLRPRQPPPQLGVSLRRGVQAGDRRWLHQNQFIYNFISLSMFAAGPSKSEAVPGE